MRGVSLLFVIAAGLPAAPVMTHLANKPMRIIAPFALCGPADVVSQHVLKL